MGNFNSYTLSHSFHTASLHPKAKAKAKAQSRGQEHRWLVDGVSSDRDSIVCGPGDRYSLPGGLDCVALVQGCPAALPQRHTAAPFNLLPSESPQWHMGTGQRCAVREDLNAKSCKGSSMPFSFIEGGVLMGSVLPRQAQARPRLTRGVRVCSKSPNRCS